MAYDWLNKVLLLLSADPLLSYSEWGADSSVGQQENISLKGLCNSVSPTWILYHLL